MWLGGPVAGDESPVPTQDGRGRDEQPEASAGREQSGQAAIRAGRAADPRSGGAPVEHGEWWRRTRISISLVVPDRVRRMIQLRRLEHTR